MHFKVTRWNQHWITLNTPSHLAGRVPAKRAIPLSSALTSEIFYIAQKIAKQDVIGMKGWLGLFIMFHQSWSKVKLWKQSLSATSQMPFQTDMRSNQWGVLLVHHWVSMHRVILKCILRCAIRFKSQHGNILVGHSDFCPLRENYHRLAHTLIDENAILTTEKGVKTCQNG